MPDIFGMAARLVKMAITLYRNITRPQPPAQNKVKPRYEEKSTKTTLHTKWSLTRTDVSGHVRVRPLRHVREARQVESHTHKAVHKHNDTGQRERSTEDGNVPKHEH